MRASPTCPSAGSMAGCSSIRSPPRRSATIASTPRSTTSAPRAGSRRSISARACSPNSMRSTPARCRARTRSTRRSCATSCAPTSGTCRRFQCWAWDPQVYNGLAGGAIYNLMARDFAPMPERLKIGDRAHGEDPGAVRADARQPRSGARAEDPCRNRRQAERRRARAWSTSSSRPTPAQLTATTARASTPPSPACARPSPTSRRGSTRRWCRTRRATSASAQKLYDEKLQFSLDSLAVARGDPAARRGRTDARARRDVRHRAHRAQGQAARTGDAGHARPTTQQQKAIEAALELAYAEQPGARRGRRRRQAGAGRRDRVRAREGPGHRARATGQGHPDAGIPARRRGRVLRFARPARQGPGHLLRDLADPGRLDARSRSIRSCANTTRA